MIGPVLVHSGECVFGACDKGLFWWNIDLGRVVLMSGSDVLKASALELYEDAGICTEHGLEGTLSSMCDSFKTAFRWLGGESVPTATLH